jgi:hypothetical protein
MAAVTGYAPCEPGQGPQIESFPFSLNSAIMTLSPVRGLIPMRWFLAGVLLSFASIAQAALCCPFCGASGMTLTQEAGAAALIIYGVPKSAKLDPNEPNLGTTEIEIESIIKAHAIIGNKKTITIAKYIPQVDPPMKFLIFADVYKGQLDAYRGTPFKMDSRIDKYLKGAIALKDKDIGTRLRFFFDYLDDPDPEISEDALKEFGNSDYKDYRPVAEKFPVDRIRGWLKDPGTPVSRLGLYGSMLGHCGKAEDAKLLRTLIDDNKKRYTGAIDGILAGLVMLDSKDGWAMVAETLSDSKRDFLLRYAALRTARFFGEFRTDVVAKDKVCEAVMVLLDQPDLVDLAIEDLRKWGYWKAAPRILGLFGKEGYEVPIVRRAILRYMLKCPASEFPEAPVFVADQRTKNQQWVEEVESLLNNETPISLPPSAKSK